MLISDPTGHKRLGKYEEPRHGATATSLHVATALSSRMPRNGKKLNHATAACHWKAFSLTSLQKPALPSKGYSLAADPGYSWIMAIHSECRVRVMKSSQFRSTVHHLTRCSFFSSLHASSQARGCWLTVFAPACSTTPLRSVGAHDHLPRADA
jgi:hypothetical protein